MGIFELRKDFFADCFWFKCLCSGQGGHCPNLFSADGLKALVTPIQMGRTCCIESACGCRDDGKIMGCIPHPIEDYWCMSKCCCQHSYCGVPWMGPDKLKTWFQCCCLAVEQTSPKLIPFGQWKKDFCWFKCCCQGQGLDCDNINSFDIACVKSMCQPVSMAKMCCVQSSCGLADGKCFGCFPHPLEEVLCAEKCLCFYSYCGFAPCMADPLQFCCLAFFVDMAGQGAAFKVEDLKEVKINTADLV